MTACTRSLCRGADVAQRRKPVPGMDCQPTGKINSGKNDALINDKFISGEIRHDHEAFLRVCDLAAVA